MRLGFGEYVELEKRVVRIIRSEMIEYNRVGELDYYLKEINIYNKIFDRRKDKENDYLDGKIAVIGQSKPKEHHLLGIAKDLGFNPDQFEFCLEYEDVEKYNFDRLKNDRYSLILIGPMGHKQKNLDGYSSMMEKLKSEKGFPEVVELRDSNNLKITKSNFREALESILDKNELVG